MIAGPLGINGNGGDESLRVRSMPLGSYRKYISTRTKRVNKSDNICKLLFSTLNLYNGQLTHYHQILFLLVHICNS